MPAETRSLDEIWVDLTPEELADWFEDRSRERFRLALADLLALDDAAPVIVDGPQLLPELVAEVASSPQAALYIVAQPEVQRRLVHERGRGVAERTRDPERAFANRLGRDEELVRRLRAAAAGHGFPVVEVVDVRETLPQVEAPVPPPARRVARGAARRRLGPSPGRERRAAPPVAGCGRGLGQRPVGWARARLRVRAARVRAHGSRGPGGGRVDARAVAAAARDQAFLTTASSRPSSWRRWWWQRSSSEAARSSRAASSSRSSSPWPS